MSFCRWSTDDFLCDLYCYESDAGFVTHVANRKRVYKVPLPPSVEGERGTDAWWELYWKRYAVMDAMEEGRDYDYEPIGLAHDGESFTDDNLEDFIATLEMLKLAGYRFPVELIEGLRISDPERTERCDG